MVKLSVLAHCVIATFIGQSTGHFLLDYPPGVGFDDDLEGNAPCGGFPVDFSKNNVTDFHVGGDVLAMQSIHPQATWLFRATLDTTASGNWTNLMPAVLQTGLGDFCEPDVVIPAAWAGAKGVIGIVQDAPDGILYQCAAVNFVNGTGATQSTCKNVTGTVASFTADPALSSLPATATSSGSSTGTATTTSSSTTTAKPSSANTVCSYSRLGMFAWVVAVGSVTFMAFLL